MSQNERIIIKVRDCVTFPFCCEEDMGKLPSSLCSVLNLLTLSHIFFENVIYNIISLSIVTVITVRIDWEENLTWVKCGGLILHFLFFGKI